MQPLIVRDQQAAKLAAADAPLPVCTPDGEVLGYFTPLKAKKLRLEPPASKEELDARFAAGGGRPLADILRDLEAKG